MMLSELFLRLTEITNNTCDYSRVPVILRTLDGDYGVSCVEYELDVEYEDGKLVFHTDEMG